jgi:hypothetical protein
MTLRRGAASRCGWVDVSPDKESERRTDLFAIARD